MKIYCRKCGNPTEYTAKYPSFCSGCGNPLNASAARMGKPPVDDEPEEDYVAKEETPTISKLDVDIQLYDKNSMTIGDIAGSSSESSDDFDRKAPNKKERKALMDDFFREAGANQKPKN
jgi:hypothetical protein